LAEEKQWLHRGGAVDRVHVSLGVYSDNLDPDEITRVLGLEPTKAFRKGQIKIGKTTGREYVQRTGAWLLRVPLPEQTAIEEQLKWLLTGLPDDIKIWRELTTRFNVRMLCGIHMDNPNRGFALSTEIMKRLVERGLGIEFDIYGPDPELEHFFPADGG